MPDFYNPGPFVAPAQTPPVVVPPNGGYGSHRTGSHLPSMGAQAQAAAQAQMQAQQALAAFKAALLRAQTGEVKADELSALYNAIPNIEISNGLQTPGSTNTARAREQALRAISLLASHNGLDMAHIGIDERSQPWGSPGANRELNPSVFRTLVDQVGNSQRDRRVADGGGPRQPPVVTDPGTGGGDTPPTDPGAGDDMTPYEHWLHDHPDSGLNSTFVQPPQAPSTPPLDMAPQPGVQHQPTLVDPSQPPLDIQHPPTVIAAPDTPGDPYTQPPGTGWGQGGFNNGLPIGYNPVNPNAPGTPGGPPVTGKSPGGPVTGKSDGSPSVTPALPPGTLPQAPGVPTAQSLAQRLAAPPLPRRRPVGALAPSPLAMPMAARLAAPPMPVRRRF